METENPNCVFLGDAVEEFSYASQSKNSFSGGNLSISYSLSSWNISQVLHKSNSMQLFSLGKGKFHKENSGLNLDIEPFTAALEFASEKKAVEKFSCGYDL